MYLKDLKLALTIKVQNFLINVLVPAVNINFTKTNLKININFTCAQKYRVR